MIYFFYFIAGILAQIKFTIFLQEHFPSNNIWVCCKSVQKGDNVREEGGGRGGGEERGLPLIVLGHFSYDTFIKVSVYPK